MRAHSTLLRLVSVLLSVGPIGCSSASSPGASGPDASPPTDASPPLDAPATHADAAVEASTPVDAAAETGAPEAAAPEAGADASSSFYDTACSASSMTCPDTPLICQKFSFGGGAISTYACTKPCSSVGDCDTTDPTVQCLPFTTSGFCVIVCDATSTSPTACPGPLKCVANGGSTIGICVTL
jgi:hypothetical protein